MSARDVVAKVELLSDQYGGTFKLSVNDADRILAALSAAGFVVVSSEIDTSSIPLIEALNGGGCQGWGGHIINEHVADARRKWKRILSAMLSAAEGEK